jgi:DNA-directed RNA polymerase subunit L
MITRNSSAESKHIYSSQISGETTEKLCNDQFIILALNPGKYIEIKNIRVVEEYGYVNGTHNASYNCSLNPLDIDMEAEQSTNSNPTKFAISIDTNGNMGSKQFMKKCFSELKDRFLKINIDSLESSGNKHILKIYGESHSVGNILCYGMINLYPEIEFIAPSFPGNSHNVFINIIHRDAQELKELLREIIKNAIENFSVLSDACDKK